MSNTIASLSQEVYTLTRRPDLSALTSQSIRKATLQLHQRVYYERDMVEFMIDFGNCCYTQQFPYLQFQPMWRALKYFKHPDRHHHYDNAFEGERILHRGYNNKEFAVVTPDNVFNYFGFEKGDVAYLSGVNWNLRGKFAFRHVVCGCYLNPNVTPDGYSSWIADNYEFAVIYLAAASIGSSIGLDAEAKGWMEEAAIQMAIIDTGNITGVGA